MALNKATSGKSASCWIQWKADCFLNEAWTGRDARFHCECKTGLEGQARAISKTEKRASKVENQQSSCHAAGDKNSENPTKELQNERIPQHCWWWTIWKRHTKSNFIYIIHKMYPALNLANKVKDVFNENYKNIDDY